MNILPFSPARLARLVLVALPLAAVAALSFAPTPVWASSGSQFGSIGQYGEVTRLGGFDTTAYDNGLYDQPLTPGTFLNPVGFAVDTHDTTSGGDGTALYVLDRVSDYAEVTAQPGTEWRLQKLSDSGAVLGSTEFYLPKTPAGYTVPVAALGLAIDDTTGRIYTLITEIGEAETPVVKEILGWSTTPVSEKLVAPGASGSYPALPADSLSTPVTGYGAPGLLSTAAQLAGASLYSPQGLALDVTGGQDDLAVEADGLPRTEGGAFQGPTVVQQVSTSSGATADSWSSTSLAGVDNASSADLQALAGGISTNPDGSLSVLIRPVEPGETQRDVINLSAGLGSPTVLASSAIVALSDSWSRPISVHRTSFTLPSANALELSNGLYASDYWFSAGVGYWNAAKNEGIRLVQPESDGLLSNPLGTATSIFDTLGNAASGGACNLADEGVNGGSNNVSLAAGANGAVWVLTAGKDSSNGATPANVTGRQLIELSPTGGTPCVDPSGTFTVANATAGSAAQPASTTNPLTVQVGAKVEFDASTISYPTSETATNGAIFAYDWDPTGGGYTLDNTTEEFQPTATATYTYTTPGVYPVKLKLLGDFGEYDQEGTVVVQTTGAPVAAFTAPAGSQTGQATALDGSGSQPANGAHIAAYHWSFGDGQSDDTQTPSESHAYSSAGTYTISLTVRDNDNRQSAAVTRQITVSNPPPSGGSGGGGSGTTTTTTSTSATTTPLVTPTVKVDRSATALSPTVAGVSGGVKVTLSCPATKVSCAGNIQIKTATAVVASVAKAGRKAKTKKHKSVLVLGQKTFNLSAGQHQTFTIKLSSKGLALVKSSKRLKVVVLVTARDSVGDPGSATAALTLTSPAKKKK